MNFLKIRKPDPLYGSGFIKKRYTLFEWLVESGFRGAVIQNAYVGTVAFFSLERNCSIGKGVKGKIFADAYIPTRVEFSASLADDDITCNGGLTSKKLNT